MIGLLVLGLWTAAADDGADRDGNVDQEVRLSIRKDAIEIDYVVQLGRQAAFAEVLQIDVDRDGRLSREEQASYFARLEETIRTGLELRVEGRDVALRRVGEVRLEMPFRKIYRFEAARPDGRRLEFHNENFASSPGATSMIVQPESGLDVVVDGSPGSLRRDLVCEMRAGEGRILQESSPRLRASGGSGSGILFRILFLVGLPAAGGLAWRRRRAASLAAIVAAGLCGVAALRTGTPPEAEATSIFLALHGEAVRASDASLRRIKPIETRILPSPFAWLPEFQVRHRWTAYRTLQHSDHVHPEVEEHEACFVVSWKDGDWRLSSPDERPEGVPRRLVMVPGGD